MFSKFPPHGPTLSLCFGEATSCKHTLDSPAASALRWENAGTGCHLHLRAHSCPRCREPCLFQEVKPAHECSSGPVLGRGRTGDVRTPEAARTWSSPVLETAGPGVSGGAKGGSGSGVAQKLKQLGDRPMRNYHRLRRSWTTCIHGSGCGIRPWH